MNTTALRRFVMALISVAVAMAQNQNVEAAWKLLAQGRRDEAVATLRQLIQSDPRNADARLLLGSVLMEAGQRAESITQLKEAVRLLPESAEAHNALGEAYNAFGEPSAARPEFARAVELDPKHAQAQANLGDVLAQQNEPDAAIPHLDAAIRLFGAKSDAAYPHYVRGKIFLDRQDAAKAAAEFDRATELRPDLAEAWSDLGNARKLLADDAGALAAFRRAVALNTEDAVARYRLGAALLDSGSPHQAVEQLEAAVRLDPRDQSALNALQRALRQDGQLQRAETVKAALAALIRDRDDRDQKMVAALELNNRGAELEKAGDIRAALEKYRAALEILPDHVGIRTNLAVALLKLGEWEDGVNQMREALRRDPDNAELRKAFESAVAQAKAHGIDPEKK